MVQPSVVISVYPEHFIVSLDYNGTTFEASSESLSTALFEIAEELEIHEDV